MHFPKIVNGFTLVFGKRMYTHTPNIQRIVCVLNALLIFSIHCFDYRVTGLTRRYANANEMKN